MLFFYIGFAGGLVVFVLAVRAAYKLRNPTSMRRELRSSRKEIGHLVMSVGFAASIDTERCLVTYVYRTKNHDYSFTLGPDDFEPWERDSVLSTCKGDPGPMESY